MKTAASRTPAWPVVMAIVGLIVGTGCPARAETDISFTLTEPSVLTRSARSFANAIYNDGRLIVDGQCLLSAGKRVAIEVRPTFSSSSPPLAGHCAAGIDSADITQQGGRIISPGGANALLTKVISVQRILLDGLVRIRRGVDHGKAGLQGQQLLDFGSGCECCSRCSSILADGDVQALPSFSVNGLPLSLASAALPEPASWLLWVAGNGGGLLQARATASSTSPRTST